MMLAKGQPEGWFLFKPLWKFTDGSRRRLLARSEMSKVISKVKLVRL
jgi:hypothetical protein